MVVAIAALCVGCATAPEPPAVPPSTIRLDEHAGRSELSLDIAGETIRVWVVRSDKNPAVARSSPAVLIPAPGTDVLGGATLEEFLSPTLARLANDGLIVIAFDLPGRPPADGGFESIKASLETFIRTDGGATAVKRVLDLVETSLPEVDPKRIGLLGIGSGGAVAVRAAGDARVAGVVLVEPVESVVEAVGPGGLSLLADVVPAVEPFARDRSPDAIVPTLAKPVLILSSEDSNLKGKNLRQIVITEPTADELSLFPGFESASRFLRELRR